MGMINHNKFSVKQVKFILDNFDEMTNRKIANNIGLSINQVRSIYRKYGLSRTKARYFKKGHTPWNKGKSVDIGGIETRFKKGNQPKNARPIGSMRTTKDGYYEIKVSRNKWQSLHSRVWELLNGGIPAKHLIIFKKDTPDKLNFTSADIELVSRSEFIKRNANRKKAAAALRETNKLKRQDYPQNVGDLQMF